VAKRSAGVPSSIGRQNLNDEELVNNNNKSNLQKTISYHFSVHMYIKKLYKH
jgi:hypothetical protein